MFYLPLHSLIASARYCVIRDPILNESIVVDGRTLQSSPETYLDFHPFALDEPLPHDHVRVVVGDFSLAIWRDASRPELNIPRELEPEVVPCRSGDPTGLILEDRSADLDLAKELAEPDPDSWEYYLTIAARRFAQSLYAQP